MAEIIKQLELGNIFTEGSPLRFGLDLPVRASWRLQNVSGETVLQGEARAGESELVLVLPPGERGHYRLTLNLAAAGGPQQASTTLAVLSPFDLGRVRDSPFGVCTHFGQLRGENHDLEAPSRVNPEVIPLVAHAGFKTHRDELPWNRVEPDKGAFVFPNAHRTYMASCGLHAVGSLIILDYGNRHYDSGNAPHSAEGLAGFARYAQRVVTRYGAQITAVEVWNEYNGTFSKGPAAKRPEGYLELLKHTYRAVKEVRPELSVVGPAGVTLPYGWLERLFALGALDYLDAVSVHPYIYPAAPDRQGELDRKLDKLHALIGRYSGGKPKPVYLTEIGWTTRRGGVSALDQGRFAVRAFVMALSTGVAQLYWYELVNGGTDRTKREHTFGLLRHPDDPLGAYTPMLAYVTLAVLTRQLSGARFRERDRLSNPLYSYLFERDGDEVRVMWRAGVTQTITLHADAPLTVTDMVGKTRVVEPQEGRVDLTLSENPLYVAGKVQRVGAATDVLGMLEGFFNGL